MSKVLRTAALVVGGIALVATGVGAFVGAAAPAWIGVTAKVATYAAVGLSAAAQITAPRPKFDQASTGTDWLANPYAGLPYAMGETAVGGNIVFRRTDDAFAGGEENDLQTVVTVLSCAGPVQAIDGVDVDRVSTSFDPGTGAASGPLGGFLWWKGQLGAQPEAAQLNIAAGSSAAPLGWTANHKLSGLAADMVRMRFDSKGERFAQGEPQIRRRGRWVKVYDPRLDSTYPGGSGSCRPFVESTYVWSRNPHLHALTWVMGRYANGKLICGLGQPFGAIIVDDFIEGANICDANGWHCDGVIFTRPQTAWNNLKLILEAGAATPYNVGGRVGCRNQMPRVAVGSITSGDLRGEVALPATRPRRERKNMAFIKYRSPAHEYELVDIANPVRIAALVTADRGEERPLTWEYPLVESVTQATVLGAYQVFESREADLITYVLGPRFHAFKPGDCLTDDTPEGGGMLVRIEQRSLDLESGTVTLVCRTETTAKHADALALVGQAPPVVTPPAVPGAPAAPGVSAWSASGTAISAAGGAIPALVITGEADNPAATEVLFWYRPNGGDGVWRAAGTAPPTATRHEITAVTPGTAYDVGISYRVRGIIGTRRELGPVTAGSPVLVWGNVAGPNRPADNADVTRETVPDLPTGEHQIGRNYLKGQTAFQNGSTFTARIDHLASAANAPPNEIHWVLSAVAADQSKTVQVGLLINYPGFGTAGEMSVRAGPGGNVALSMSATVRSLVTSIDDLQVRFQMQRFNGSIWVDIGAFVDSVLLAPTDVSTVSFDRTVTGLTPGALVPFRLLQARIGPNDPDNVVTAGGTWTGAGS